MNPPQVYMCSPSWTLLPLHTIPLGRPSALAPSIQFQLLFNSSSNGTPLQYSCLENPMDGGDWWAAVHGVAKSRTRLSDFTFTFMHWRRKWQPTPVFLPGESQRQGSLVGWHLWGHTESDTTEVTMQQQQHKICFLDFLPLFLTFSCSLCPQPFFC